MLKLTPSPRIYIRLVGIWIVLAIGGITFALFTWEHLDASISGSMQLRQLRHALEDTQDNIQDAESAQRGYLLTGDEAYLVPFRSSENTLHSKLEQLIGLSKADPEVLKGVLELQSLAWAKMDEMKSTIVLRQTQGESAAVAVVKTNRGLSTMTGIRDVLDRLDQRLRTIGTERNNATDADLRHALITTVSGGIVGLGAGILALYLSYFALKQEKRSREFAEQLIRAERSALQKSTFLANMSHEIRTPMTAILGFSELLTNDQSASGKSLHYANSIRQSAHALLQLINDILDVAKLDVGMVVLHPEPVDLQDVLDFVATIFSQQMALKSLSFRITQGPGIPRSLLLDRSRVRQILINLVNNAMKFTEIGDVTVHADWEPDYTDRRHGTLLFEISDTGIGIPPEKWDSIFEPFVQLDAARGLERQGSGLGLSIVKSLVGRMGGTISLEKSSDQGSLFMVRIPNVAVSARAATTTTAELPTRTDFNNLRPSTILVVDDNSVNRELLGEMFHATHHTVYFATNGHEAVASVKNRKPDLVLMDLSMPALDGRKAFAEIRLIPGAEQLPVVAISASSLHEEELSLKTQFAGFVRKPFTRKALFDQLEAIVGLRLQSPTPSEEIAPKTPLPVNSKDPIFATPAERWLYLVEILHKIESTQWRAVCDSGAINETKAFAKHLHDLGSHNACPILVTYASSLMRDAEDYSVVRLDSRLNEFPDVITAIAREANPKLAP